MRIGPEWVLAAALALAPPGRADERSQALTVVEAAIQAHGGAEALARTQTVVRQSAGQMTVAGQDVVFACEYTARLPQRWRRHEVLRVGDQALHVLVVVNGDRGWQSSGGAVTTIAPERLKELREDAYAQWLTTLLPLKKESSLQLVPLPETKVNGEPAVGVKVSSKDHADVKLYFDRKTGLLVKMERQTMEAGLPVAREEIYEGYKEFDGVKLPTRVVQAVGGKKVLEITEASYRFPERIEEATFAKP